MKEVEIFFRDLSIEAQKEILKAFKIKDAKEMNWDIMPLSIIEVGE